MTELSQEVIQKKVNEYIQRIKPSPEAVIPLLQLIQQDFGYLPLSVLDELCEATGISRNHLYGVATFYSQFRMTKTGIFMIKVCKGTACHVNQADRIQETITEYLGINVNETTKDGRFSLHEVACLGCCSLSPAVMINDRVYGKLTPDKILSVLKTYEKHE